MRTKALLKLYQATEKTLIQSEQLLERQLLHFCNVRRYLRFINTVEMIILQYVSRRPQNSQLVEGKLRRHITSCKPNEENATLFPVGGRYCASCIVIRTAP